MTLAQGLSCLEAPHSLCFPYPACNADTAYGLKSELCFSSWPIGLIISANTIPCWHCGRLWPKSLTSQQKQRKILLYGPNHHYSGISNHKCDWSAWRQGKRELGLPDLMSLGKQVVFLGWIRFIAFIKSNFLSEKKKPHSPNEVSYLVMHVLRTLGFYMVEAISCRGHCVGPSTLESHLGSLYNQKRGTQANDGRRQASKPFVFSQWPWNLYSMGRQIGK